MWESVKYYKPYKMNDSHLIEFNIYVELKQLQQNHRSAVKFTVLALSGRWYKY